MKKIFFQIIFSFFIGVSIGIIKIDYSSFEINKQNFIRNEVLYLEYLEEQLEKTDSMYLLGLHYGSIYELVLIEEYYLPFLKKIEKNKHNEEILKLREKLERNIYFKFSFLYKKYFNFNEHLKKI